MIDRLLSLASARSMGSIGALPIYLFLYLVFQRVWPALGGPLGSAALRPSGELAWQMAASPAPPAGCPDRAAGP